MRLTIAISGPAWAWVVSVGSELAKLISNNWYSVLVDKEYASVIKWWNNIIFLYISDSKPYITKTIDYVFSFDSFGITKNEKIYDFKNIIEVNKESCTYQNVYTLWLAWKFLWLPLIELEELVKNTYKKDIETNILDLKKWYNECELSSNVDLSVKIWGIKELVYGNQMIAVWGIKSGMDFYSAYPMTPASTIINAVNNSIDWNEKLLDFKKAETVFYQWEDEIAVSMSMLGAKFAGKRAMCWTSGGWFALMVESMSFSGQAEIGWVYALVQRAGPSTGTPTFTEQADLDFALNSVFWDIRPIVICPSTMEETFNFSGKTLNWSDKYQMPIILISDKQMAESHIWVVESELIPEPINRGKFLENWVEWFKRYKLNDDGISPYTIPGTVDWEFITTSYEHNEYGATSEDPTMKMEMTEKRAKKMETFISEVYGENFRWYEIINPNAKKFFVTYGFNRYVTEWFVANNPDWWVIVVTMLQPLDFRLKDWLEANNSKIEKLAFVEMNHSGQFEKLIKKEFNLENDKWNSKLTHFRKYSLYPIFEEELKDL